MENQREIPKLHDVEETKDLQSKKVSILFEDSLSFYNINPPFFPNRQ